jgi:hypothetical protein
MGSPLQGSRLSSKGLVERIEQIRVFEQFTRFHRPIAEEMPVGITQERIFLYLVPDTHGELLYCADFQADHYFTFELEDFRHFIERGVCA